MKVLDIITEAPKANPDAIRNLSPDQITQFLDHWNKTNPHGFKIDAQLRDESENFFQRWLRNRQNLIAVEEARVARTVGWAGPLIQIAGFVTVVAMWRLRMLAINDMAVEKNPDGSYKYTAQQILEQRNLATGMFVTSNLIEWIIRSIKGGRLISAIALMLRGGSKALMGRGGVWAAAVAFIASEALIQGLKIWLNTDSGREWFCRNFIVKMIVGYIGSMTEEVIGGIVNAIHDSTGINLDTTPNITQREKEIPKFDIPKLDPKAAADADMKDRLNRYVPDATGKTWSSTPRTQ